MDVPLIVVGVDGSPAAQGALAWALDEARLRNAEVLALYACTLDAALAPPAVPLDVEALTATAEEFLEAEVARVPGSDDVVLSRRVVNCPPAEALIEAARDADILVVGARGLGGFKGLLVGCVSNQCAQHADCPVVVVHDRTAGGRTRTRALAEVA